MILVSAQGPNPSFFLFGGTYIQLGGLLDPVRPRLDNIITPLKNPARRAGGTKPSGRIFEGGLKGNCKKKYIMEVKTLKTRKSTE